jgi:arylsulfatase A-like enzyme
MGAEENFYRPASQLHDASLKWLSRQDPPMFAWIHYMDPHHPFEAPAEYLEERELHTSRSRSELSQLTRDVIKANGGGYSMEDIEDVKQAYEAACEYQADETIAFVKRLKEQDLYDPDRDIFVFTADHGECLSYKEYEMMGHVPPALWEGVIHVPLVVSMPEWEQETVHEQASLAHLYETIRAAVSHRINESDKKGAFSSKRLTTDAAHFVTEWEIPNDGSVHTYRGVRTAEGMKLFGGHIRGEDKVVLTRYDTDILVDEIQFESGGTSPPTDSESAAIWKELTDTIEERGPVLEDDQTLKGEINEEHLRDLGYLE